MYSVVGGDGQVYGPVGVETIKEWAAQGRVAGRTNLIDPISGRVLRAEDLDELREVFHPAPPVAPVATGDPPLLGRATTIERHPFAAPEAPMPQLQMPQPAPLPAGPPLPAISPTDIGPATGPRLRSVPDPIPSGVVSATQVNVGGGRLGTEGQPTVQVNSVVAVQHPPYPPYPPHSPSGVGGYPSHYAPQQQAYHGVQNAYVHAPKSKVAAVLLCVFLGMLGIHRFYLGHTGAGIALLLMTALSFGILWPVTFVWAVIDLIMICTGSLRDSHNQRLAD